MSDPPPPASWLGYSLDLTTVNPQDIHTASSGVQKTFQFFNPHKLTGEHVHSVPNDVSVKPHVEGVVSGHVSYPSGQAASSDFNSDHSLCSKFFAIAAPPSLRNLTDKLFTDDSQFAFFSLSDSQTTAYVENYGGLLRESALEQEIAGLPNTFDSSDPKVVQAYKDILRTLGTHIIVSATAGLRYQMAVWAQTDLDKVNKSWWPDVLALFNGIPDRSSYNSKIPKQAQYQSFLDYYQCSVSVQGGDAALAKALRDDPTSYEKYEAWVEGPDGSDIISFGTIELWDLLRGARSRALKAQASNIQDAFEFLTGNIAIVETEVTLDIEADWAEFGVLVPGASINIVTPDGDDEPPLANNNITHSRTKVQYKDPRGQSSSGKVIRLYFTIVNNGSPIDFYISHGDGAKKGEPGKAVLRIGQESYENSIDTGSANNTVWFYQVPVTGDGGRGRD